MKTLKILAIVAVFALFFALAPGGPGDVLASDAGDAGDAGEAGDAGDAGIAAQDDGRKPQNEKDGDADARTIPLKLTIDGEEKEIEISLPGTREKAQRGVNILAEFMHAGILQGNLIKGLFVAVMAFFLLVLSMRLFPRLFDFVGKRVAGSFLSSLVMGIFPVVGAVVILILLGLLAHSVGATPVKILAFVLFLFLAFIIIVITLLTSPAIVEGLGRKLLVDRSPDEKPSGKNAVENGPEDEKPAEEKEQGLPPGATVPSRFRCLAVGVAFIAAVGWIPIFGWLFTAAVIALSWGAAVSAIVKK